MKFVSIIMGSKSDLEVMRECESILKELGIAYEMIISSAHRTPKRTAEYVQEATNKGAEVFICAAGMAAHLAGAVAANTIKPVIGVPMFSNTLSGADALYSTVMMPGGIPVATVAIGKAGAKNAAYLAAQILATSDEELAKKLKANREQSAKNVESDSKSIEVRIK